MPNINDEYLDAAVRHQVEVRRTSNGEVLLLLALFELADRDLAKRIRSFFGSMAGQPHSISTKKIQSWFESLKKNRSETLSEFAAKLKSDLKQLAKIEAAAEQGILETITGKELARVTNKMLRDLLNKPFGTGSTLNQMLRALNASDQARLIEALQMGISQGMTTDQLMAYIVGTKANRFSDGVLATTRRQAETVVRTAMTHTTNAAREQFWLLNQELFSGLKWVSVLDSRTTALCRSRDGRYAPLGLQPLPPGVPLLEPPSARPPAHPNCRSTMIAVLANQPLPKDVTYGEWLKRQPATFQDKVLGKTKGKLFREGGMSVDQFVDRAGNELTLDELAASNPKAFIKAGLNPDKF